MKHLVNVWDDISLSGGKCEESTLVDIKPKDILENILEKKRLTLANSGLQLYHMIPRDATEEHAKNCTKALRLYFVILYILLGIYLPCGLAQKIDLSID